MHNLIARAEPVAVLLRQRQQTIAIAESSTGGLIAAALLAIPGASAYFLGGAVVYTKQARSALLELGESALDGFRPSTERYASLLANTVKTRFSADWGFGESGATGPAGNRYGDAAGHSCMAIAGHANSSITIETGHGERYDNMLAFATAALDLMEGVLRR